MEPIKLWMQDFCGHSKSEIDFTSFSSALILGKIKGDDKSSNGSGKSTIFNAIEYVLFNEIKVSTLDKIIKDGADICRVGFDFRSNFDNQIYRIVRSISKKSGSDVRLYRQNENNWEDITQRRIADNEKEITKLIKVNYKAFCASVLFPQIGSENPSQRDYSNIASITPEKRKSILKEVLSLNIYSNYEKFTKTKIQSLVKDVEKNKTILSTFKDPGEEITQISSSINDLNKKIESNNEQISQMKHKISVLNEEKLDLTSKLKSLQDGASSAEEQYSAYNKKIISKKSELSSLEIKMKSILNEGISLKKDLEKLNAKIKETIIEKADGLEEKKTSLIKKTNEIKAELISLSKRESELLIPIPTDGFCKHCRQKLTKEHIEYCQQQDNIELKEISSLKIKLNNNLKELTNQHKLLEEKISSIKAKENLLKDINASMSMKTKELELKREKYNDMNSLKLSVSKEIDELSVSIKKIEEYKKEVDVDKISLFSSKILEIKRNLSIVEEQNNSLTLDNNSLISKKAVLEHRLEEERNNIIKINKIKDYISDLDKNIQMHNKVSEAFGSDGIPSFIISNVLDDFQYETNEWLAKFRPGLQAQFSLVKSKNNGEQDDTLDITYVLDGFYREYKQLSGAQKLIATLALKLSISSLLKKKLGVDLKILLLDEVDQALDDGNVGVFSDIIRELQKDFKILVITHNSSLKEKFNYAIVVEQDDSLNSVAKLVKNW